MLEVYIDKTQVETLILACKYLVGQKIFRKCLVSLNCKCRRFQKRDENLPLGHLNIIPKFIPDDYKSIAKYLVLAER